MKPKVLLIIPAYNEAGNIEKVVKDLKNNANDVDYVIINDASKDNTLEICQKNNYNCINGLVNLGLWGAVQTGLKYAMDKNYDIAIQFDGDGQHSAKYVKYLVDEIENGIDIAIGSRFVTVKKPWSLRMLGSRLISACIFLTTGKKITDPTSGMRAYNKNIIKEYALDMNNPPDPDTLVYMLKKKKKIKEIQVEMSEREQGTSSFNVGHTIRYMCRMIISIFFIQPFRKRK